MKILPKIFYSAILIKVLIWSCDASTLNFEENVLRQRKNSMPNRNVEKNTYIKLEKNSFEQVYQSKAVAKYADFCIKNKRNFNVEVILEELRKVSHTPWNYKINAIGYKNHIKNKFFVPDYLINELYKDLVTKIKQEISEECISESEDSQQ